MGGVKGLGIQKSLQLGVGQANDVPCHESEWANLSEGSKNQDLMELEKAVEHGRSWITLSFLPPKRAKEPGLHLTRRLPQWAPTCLHSMAYAPSQ